jgi:predicted nucleic acid-binding protein
VTGLYFDTAYVGKCYLNEPDAVAVREAARSADNLFTSALTIAELACAFHRNLREGTLNQAGYETARRQFQDDLQNEIWNLIPVTDHILRQVDLLVRRLPPNVFLRAGDAIHIVSAVDAGFNEISTNDRHLLAAAAHFGMKGRTVRARSKH